MENSEDFFYAYEARLKELSDECLEKASNLEEYDAKKWIYKSRAYDKAIDELYKLLNEWAKNDTSETPSQVP